MKENMMKNKVFVSIPMNKIYATCIIGAVAWCATAQACSPPLDGSDFTCPPWDVELDDLKPKPLIPKQELKGEIDIYEPMHWHQMQMMFLRNARRTQIEENATLPSDAINNALDNFWEQENGSNGSTEQEKLL